MSTSAPSTALRPDKFRIADVVYAFTTLDSTNALAAKLLTGFRPKHGTVILADYQTAGRGQIGRTWQSAAGDNLCFSVILYPGLRPVDQFVLNMAVSLAVRDAVHTFCRDTAVTVKWPNDIYADDRKIAGLLIQNTIQGSAITSTIAGIGLNVDEVDFPAELPNPTSIRKILAQHGTPLPERMSVFREVIRHLDSRFEGIRETDHQAIKDAYHQNLYRKDILTTFSFPGSTGNRRGHIRQVDESGRLVIEWEDGTEGRFAFREVEMRI